jgi:hypothetical protein
MTTKKASLSVFGLVVIGFMIVSLVGIVLLVVLIDELHESGWVVPSFVQPYYNYRAIIQKSAGNEFTGEMTALLFVASIVPVGIDLLSRAVIRYPPFGQRVKTFVRRVNNSQRKYLMPFHTYLSILALGLGILHLALSSCVANPFPELGLILSGILVATGLLFKWKALPSKFRKTLYQFHSSLIILGVLLVILYTGHAVMDLSG